MAPLRRAASSQTFSNELAMWDLLGFFYGKHFYKTESAVGQ
jgi:hypothetical protein